jgi:hypothetical protein
MNLGWRVVQEYLSGFVPPRAIFSCGGETRP